MKIVAGTSSDHLTLADLRKFVERADMIGFPDDSRIGAKTGISIKEHAPVKAISVEDEEG